MDIPRAESLYVELPELRYFQSMGDLHPASAFIDLDTAVSSHWYLQENHGNDPRAFRESCEYPFQAAIGLLNAQVIEAELGRRESFSVPFDLSKLVGGAAEYEGTQAWMNYRRDGSPEYHTAAARRIFDQAKNAVDVTLAVIRSGGEEVARQIYLDHFLAALPEGDRDMIVSRALPDSE